MTRWLLVLLALLLPLQMAWANLAGGCHAMQPMESSQTLHQGHDGHEDAALHADGDCESACEQYCHNLPALAPALQHFVGESSPQSLAAAPIGFCESSRPHRPERPKWRPLA